MKTNSFILSNHNDSYFIEDSLNSNQKEISKETYDRLINESANTEKLNDEKLLVEFTINDWIPQVMPIIKRTSKVRGEVAGQEKVLSKILGIEGKPNSPIITFLTTATFEKSKKYRTKIQLMDLNKWRKDKYLYNMNGKEFKEILDVCDIRMSCNCKAYHWLGISHYLDQLDSSIEHQPIPAPIWSKRKGYDSPSVCKHLKGIIKLIKPNSNKILDRLKSQFSVKYRNKKR